MLTFIPLTPDYARQMARWRYPEQYSMYNNLAEDEALEDDIAFMTDPANQYYAILDGEDFIGHCVFGEDARVRGGDYSADALDIGIGMRPDQTGQGRGTQITQAVMQHGRSIHPETRAFRATIAAWNKRAQQVCLNNGFTIIDQFNAAHNDMTFVIVWRDTK